jgi:hypothetical protein
MSKLATLALLALTLCAGYATADESTASAAAAPPACWQAEVNPVTGHTLCINPLGAPVAPPQSSALPPCAPNTHGTKIWSYQPNCEPTRPGGA